MFVHRKKGFVWKFLISVHFIDVLGRLLKKGCGYFYKGNKIESLKNINLALKINPEEKRIIKNKKIITESIEASNAN